MTVIWTEYHTTYQVKFHWCWSTFHFVWSTDLNCEISYKSLLDLNKFSVTWKFKHRNRLLVKQLDKAKPSACNLMWWSSQCNYFKTKELIEMERLWLWDKPFCDTRSQNVIYHLDGVMKLLCWDDCHIGRYCSMSRQFRTQFRRLFTLNYVMAECLVFCRTKKPVTPQPNNVSPSNPTRCTHLWLFHQ